MVFNRGPCLRLDEASCILLRSNLVDYKYMRVSTLANHFSQRCVYKWQTVQVLSPYLQQFQDRLLHVKATVILQLQLCCKRLQQGF